MRDATRLDAAGSTPAAWARAVDLFAGLGGFTEGATAAGVDVRWAANHWRLAVDTHAANHPTADHDCQDLQQADWSRVPAHDLLLASPCCQGHSRAKGKERPHHDLSRSTAWAVVSCAEFHRPEVVVVENVEEFRDWALYPAWRLAMSALGYAVAKHVVDAADVGVPQHRIRLFLICTRSRSPIELELPNVAHRPIADVIDFDAGAWSPLRRPGRSAKTLARVAAGRQRFGERFVAPFYGSGSGKTGRSLERPLGTVTTRDRWLLVDGDRVRMLTIAEYLAAMAFRPDYRLPDATRAELIHMIGNAVCPPVVTWLLGEIRRAA